MRRLVLTLGVGCLVALLYSCAHGGGGVYEGGEYEYPSADPYDPTTSIALRQLPPDPNCMQICVHENRCGDRDNRREYRRCWRPCERRCTPAIADNDSEY
jgi:hypothetical protein